MIELRWCRADHHRDAVWVVDRRDDLGSAARFNPAAPLVPVLGVAVGARRLWGTRTGRWLAISLRRSCVVVAVIVLAVAALWLRQQASAALLMGG